MTKSATDVMQELLFAAVIDGIVALKDASRGVPNAMLRDIQALHPNTTFADLPKELQAAITASVRAAFTKLQKEGYTVAPAGAAQPPRPRPASPPRSSEGRRPAPSGPRPPRNDDRRPPRPGGPKGPPRKKP